MSLRFLGFFLVTIIICLPVFAANFNIVAPQDIHKLEIGAPVQTTGVVIVEPGVLGPQFFYINGAQVYSYYKDFPELDIGDKITAQGVISQSRGEKRIKTKTKDDIVVIHPNYRDPTPIVKGVNEISDSLIGQLVTIKGRVVERTGQRIFVDEGGREEVVVYIKKYTDINKSSISEGDRVEVTGVVNRSGDELRILPRGNHDLKVLKNYRVPTSIDSIDLIDVEKEDMLASSGQVVDFEKIKPYFVAASVILGVIFILLLIFKKDYGK